MYEYKFYLKTYLSDKLFFSEVLSQPQPIKTSHFILLHFQRKRLYDKRLLL